MDTLTGTRKQYQAALDRARARGGAKRVTYLGGYAYMVEGSSGGTYRVWWQGENVRCNCAAGMRGVPCWRTAAVYIRRLGQQMRILGAGLEVAA